ncbi:MAG: indolepyruvate ferredoxin oxidoreductase subunit alpha [Candidatus Aenigmatarchaeota archaeon]
MIHPVLLNKPGAQVILLGNEAIARGALEAGLDFASTYPGTPSSEVADTFAAVAREAGIYFEYSVNEKVAFEVATGAAFSGLRAMVSFKHFGLNVASDSFFPVAYIGVKGSLVVMVADDPNCRSSAQSEQDTRCYARTAHVPVLEPADPQECLEFTKLAFRVSEKYKMPVMLRSTTRVSHARASVKVGRLGSRARRKGRFIKDDKFFNSIPPHTMEKHEEILKKMGRIKQEVSEKTPINKVINPGSSKIGVVTSGGAAVYVLEALKMMGLKLPVLKLGLSHPLPDEKIKKFIRPLKKVLVVEELEPLLERSLEGHAREVNPKLRIQGKDLLSHSGEYNTEMLILALERFAGKGYKFNFQAHKKMYQALNIAGRHGVLCPGCQHRAAFWAIRKATPKDTPYCGDVGCYTLGVFPPHYTDDFVISMGAGTGVAHGINKATGQKPVAFIGDSTFLHAGMTPLLNIAYNRSDHLASPLVVLLDNQITAMTGHQPNPRTGITGMGDKVPEAVFEEIIRALGIKHLEVADQFKIKETIQKAKKLWKLKEPAALLVDRPCQLQVYRRKIRQGQKVPRFEIDQKKCTKCKVCLEEYGCPAIYREKGSYYINKNLCTGCSCCAQVCPVGAIKVGSLE